MDGGEFAALDTLQYGLARDAERAHCLAHRQEVLAGITVEAILEGFGEADTPRGAARPAGGHLVAREFVLRRTGRRLEAENTPMAAQVADAAGGEAMTICRGPLLPIGDAGDHTLGGMG